MRISRIVDLSLSLDADTQGYPGDPEVRLTPAATIDADGYNLLHVRMGSQSGTHCDAPFHFRPTGEPIDEVDLRRCVGPGVVLDVRGRPDRHRIEIAEIEPYLDRVGPGTIAVLFTGWSAHYRTPRYLAHPFLGADACRALLDRGVRTFCLDTPNVDETPDPQHPPEADWPCHRSIAAAGGIVVENLTNLAAVDFADPLISVLPLRLTGADGAPTRAVAMHLVD